MFGGWGGLGVFCHFFFLIANNRIKPEKQSKSTASINHTRLCPTAKINTLLQKGKTAPTYWADILEISKIIWVSSEEAEFQTLPEQHGLRVRHPTMQDMKATILPAWLHWEVWYAKNTPILGKGSFNWLFLKQKLMSKGPHCSLETAKNLSPNWGQVRASLNLAWKWSG